MSSVYTSGHPRSAEASGTVPLRGLQIPANGKGDGGKFQIVERATSIGPNVEHT